jgi:hypothetical protein
MTKRVSPKTMTDDQIVARFVVLREQQDECILANGISQGCRHVPLGARRRDFKQDRASSEAGGSLPAAAVTGVEGAWGDDWWRWRGGGGDGADQTTAKTMGLKALTRFGCI